MVVHVTVYIIVLSITLKDAQDPSSFLMATCSSSTIDLISAPVVIVNLLVYHHDMLPIAMLQSTSHIIFQNNNSIKEKFMQMFKLT